MSLICVGSVAYDVIEVPGREPVDVLGGSATFFSAAASMFTRPALVAVVGDDFRAEDEAFLEGLGVDTTGLERRPGSTFRWHGRYHDDMKGRDSISTELGVFADFDPVVPDSLKDPDVLFLGNIEPSLQTKVLERCGRPGLVGLDTIEIWLDGEHRERLLHLLPSVDIFFLNDEEAFELSGRKNVVSAAKMLVELGVGAVVIKRGEHGATLFHRDGIRLFPAYPVETVLDPTGAGDSFAGGAMGYLDQVHGRDLAALGEAMAAGTVIASFSVEGFGPRHIAAVTRSGFVRRLSRYADMVGFDPERVIEIVGHGSSNR